MCRVRRPGRLRASEILLASIGRRLLFVGPQLVVSLLLVKLIPGDPAALMLDPFATPDALTRLCAELGLDRPLIEQFLIYLWNLAQRDLGTSWQTTLPVTTDVAQRFPATLELATLGLLLALLIGIPLGVAGASFQRGWYIRSPTTMASWPVPCPTSGWRWS